MPNVWTGTIEDRLQRLSMANRRCDANARHCTRAAVDEYVLLPADGNFTPVEGAESVTKKSCGYHRQIFLGNGRYCLVSKRDLPRKPKKEPGKAA